MHSSGDGQRRQHAYVQHRRVVHKAKAVSGGCENCGLRCCVPVCGRLECNLVGTGLLGGEKTGSAAPKWRRHRAHDAPEGSRKAVVLVKVQTGCTTGKVHPAQAWGRTRLLSPVGPARRYRSSEAAILGFIELPKRRLPSAANAATRLQPRLWCNLHCAVHATPSLARILPAHCRASLSSTARPALRMPKDT
jgi:hypothetical protein